MIDNFSALQLFFVSIMTLSGIIMHVMKRNNTLVNAYVMQSICLVALFGIELIQHLSLGIIVVAIVMFLIKIIFAPALFLRIIKQSHLNLSTSTYLNIPLTLTVLVILIAFSQSEILAPIFSLLPGSPELRTMLISNLLISIFLIINRKGALSQIIGVLSLENSIFSLGIFLGVKQLNSLELGMLFDIFFWIVASSMFVRLIYQKFGSFDISKMNELRK